jgi:hypothetical protein
MSNCLEQTRNARIYRHERETCSVCLDDYSELQWLKIHDSRKQSIFLSEKSLTKKTLQLFGKNPKIPQNKLI